MDQVRVIKAILNQNPERFCCFERTCSVFLSVQLAGKKKQKKFKSLPDNEAVGDLPREETDKNPNISPHGR